MGGIEFLDTDVTGSTMTFDHKFIDGDGDCHGGLDAEVTVEDGKISLYDWRPEDPSPCE